MENPHSTLTKSVVPYLFSLVQWRMLRKNPILWSVLTALVLYGKPSFNPSQSLGYFICSSLCSGECLERTPCYDLCWQHWCFVENPHSTLHKVWGTLFVLPRAWTWMGSLVRISSYSYLWAWPHTEKKETELTNSTLKQEQTDIFAFKEFLFLSN